LALKYALLTDILGVYTHNDTVLKSSVGKHVKKLWIPNVGKFFTCFII